MKRKGLLLCLTFLIVCGCNQSGGTEGTPANPTTVISGEEMHSAEVPTQSTNMDMGENGIPIDEAHFGDSRFCEVLKQYDSDQNGFFSEEELAQITYLGINTWRVRRKGYTEVKGFEYFSSLETLRLESAERVEIRNLPNLQCLYVEPPSYDTDWIQIVDLQVENCPALETIQLSRITLGDGNEKGVFEVENCPKLGNVKMNHVEALGVQLVDCPALERVYMANVVLGAEKSRNGVFWIENCPMLGSIGMTDVKVNAMDARIIKTPNLGVGMDENVYFSNGLYLEDTISVNCECEAWGQNIQDFKEFLYQAEDGEVTLSKEFSLRFKNTGTHINGMEFIECAKAATEKLRDGFCVRVEEAVPTVTDLAGNKAYHILIDNEFLRRTGFEIRDAENRSVGAYDVLSVVYSDTAPDPAGFSFVWEKPVEENLEVTSYSLVKGMRFTEDATAELRVQRGNEAEVLATVTYTMYCALNEKGELTAEIRNALEEDNKIVGLAEAEEKEDAKYVPEAGEIPIDKNTFGGVMFREYLEDYVDVNRNGYLSEEERAAVDSMGLHVLRVGEDSLSGFSWFPNLESLFLPKCRKVQCIDCPKLKTIIPYPDSEDDFLEIKNCPALELIEYDSEFWEDEECWE